MATVISIVSYPFLPAKVGGQKGIALFNKFFSRYHRLICVTTRKNDPDAAVGYEVLNIISNSPWRYANVFYFFTIRKLIRQRKASHLLLEHPYYGWLGVLLKWFCGVKLIVHSHNIEGNRWKTLGKRWWKILWYYERWVHQRANYNFFIHDDDRKYAITNFHLQSERCITMTYGIEWENPPDALVLNEAKKALRLEFQIAEQEKILLFNGAFNYSPNIAALQNIISYINPVLQDNSAFQYKIIICGRDIPSYFTAQTYPDIIFAGYVDDIELYFRGADVFLNPISEGGGIKTKLVEALGNDLNSVSTRNGAIGVNPDICNGKLLVCDDGDWKAFAGLIPQAAFGERHIGQPYFDHFYWANSTRKAALFIETNKDSQ